MAIKILPRDPGFGTLLGTGLGSGLQMLAQQKMQDLTDRRASQRIEEGLIKSNIPENIANSIANLPKSMRREAFKYFTRLKKDSVNNIDAYSDSLPPQLENKYKLRNQLLTYIKNGGNKQNAFNSASSLLGISPEEAELFLSNKLNDEAIQYFLNKTNNNPKKAKKLAKKFGYEV